MTKKLGAGLALTAALLAGGCGGPDESKPEGVTEAFFAGLAENKPGEVCPLQNGDSYRIFDTIVRGTNVSAGSSCENVVRKLPQARRDTFANLELGNSGRSVRVPEDYVVGVRFPAGEGSKVDIATMLVTLEKQAGKWRIEAIEPSS